jgi:hypothetical protein
LGTGYGGVEEFAGEQPGLFARHQDGDFGGLASLGFVDGHCVERFDVAESAGREVEAAAGAVNADS